jgi:SAM-dependent methyltransferase
MVLRTVLPAVLLVSVELMLSVGRDTVKALLTALRRLCLVGSPAPTSEVDPRLLYALNEISELRQLVRMLVSESSAYKEWIAQTAGSFDAQWAQIPQGRMMLSDPAFGAASERRVIELVGRPREWFPGKSALDAGSGNGRWSVTLARLGAQVTAVDVSAAGLAEVARLGACFTHFTTLQHNILDPLPLSGPFDLVWHFGVAHHTGDTRRALQNVCAAVKVGGVLCTMIYGEPRYECTAEFSEINTYTEVRREISAMSIPERIAYLQRRFGQFDAHGWFDATSPKINDLHRFDEIREWLSRWGFRDIERVNENRNLHIRAIRARLNAAVEST